MVQYLGKFLPSAVFGMLVIYCLKNVEVLHGTHGIPEESHSCHRSTSIYGRKICFYPLQVELSVIC
ncbi:MAG: hypothetical protein ACLU00_01715 [Mediterraneibacter faecis]